MAIVANKADPVTSVDKAWHTPSRTNAGDPNGSLTPAFAGELVLDTTTKTKWRALSTENTSWVKVFDNE